LSRDNLTISLPNELSAVSRAAEQLERFCRDQSIPETIAHKLGLALDEALTNIVSHAFPDGGRHSIEVRITHRGASLTAAVSDDGVPFDPLAHPAPDVRAPVEDRKVGGLGIHLLRTLMDTAEYRRVAGRNQLTFGIRVVSTAPAVRP
jgi:serine/threonine-protein kinase RsbW